MDHLVNLVKRFSVFVPSGRFCKALINHVHASSLLTAKTKQSFFLTLFLLVNLHKDLKWLGGLFIHSALYKNLIPWLVSFHFINKHYFELQLGFPLRNGEKKYEVFQ